MLLEDGKTQTRGCKNLEMLLESMVGDGKTQPRGSKNYMYWTPPCTLVKTLPETIVHTQFHQIRNANYKHISFFFEIPGMYTPRESQDASSGFGQNTAGAIILMIHIFYCLVAQLYTY